jgi:LysM repeat protein
MRYSGAVVIAVGVLLWAVLLVGARGMLAGSSGATNTPTVVASTTAVASPSPTATATPTGTAGTTAYTVKSGDSMASIAQSHGVTLQALLAANPQISDPTRLKVGDTIRLP